MDNQTINNLTPQSAAADPAVVQLKFEKEMLEAEIVELETEKYGLLKLYFAFNQRFEEELMELQMKVMAMQLDEMRAEAATNPKKVKDLEEITVDFEKFKQYCGNDFDKTVKQEVSETDKAEMKKMFRRGSKLCHPDLVGDEQKTEAKAVFQRFQKAFMENDMPTLTAILDDLEKGMFVENAAEVSEAEKLSLAIKQLRLTVGDLEREIALLKLSDNYLIFIEPHKWDTYFAEMKSKLTKRYDELKMAKKSR